MSSDSQRSRRCKYVKNSWMRELAGDQADEVTGLECKERRCSAHLCSVGTKGMPKVSQQEAAQDDAEVSSLGFQRWW